MAEWEFEGEWKIAGTAPYIPKEEAVKMAELLKRWNACYTQSAQRRNSDVHCDFPEGVEASCSKPLTATQRFGAGSLDLALVDETRAHLSTIRKKEEEAFELPAGVDGGWSEENLKAIEAAIQALQEQLEKLKISHSDLATHFNAELQQAKGLLDRWSYCLDEQDEVGLEKADAETIMFLATKEKPE